MSSNEYTNRRKFLTRTVAGSAMTLSAGSTREVLADTRTGTTREPNLEALVACLGGDWPEPCELKPRLGEAIEHEHYRIESLTYNVEVGDRVSALLLVPNLVKGPCPAIAVWHQHAGQYDLGKSEPAGLAGNPMHHTGAALAKEGYVVLCPDALCFEERQDPDGKLKGAAYEKFEFLRYVVNGKCMAWKNILDMRRAVDYLVSREEVDANRIGCYGHSMGSTHTWLVGPHEPRIKALLGNCCLPTYDAIRDEKITHCFPNYIPGWRQYGDTPEIAALVAPRALHLNLGETDRGTPIEHAKDGVERIRKAYATANAADQFSAFIQKDVGHVLSPEMWEQARAFFAKHLRDV